MYFIHKQTCKGFFFNCTALKLPQANKPTSSISNKKLAKELVQLPGKGTVLKKADCHREFFQFPQCKKNQNTKPQVIV